MPRRPIVNQINVASTSEAPPIRKQGAKAVMLKIARRTIATLCWFYTLLLALTWLLVYTQGDQWWAATMVLFGPRWVTAVPLLILVPLALLLHRRSLLVITVAVCLVLFGILNLRVPWRKAMLSQPLGPVIRVASFNVHGKAVNQQALKQYLAEQQPQVVVLAECHWDAERILFSEPGWYHVRGGEFCIGSRFPLKLANTFAKEQLPLLHCEAYTPTGVIPVIAVHLTSPHIPIAMVLAAIKKKLAFEPHGAAELESNSKLRRRQAEQLASAGRTAGTAAIMLGDFNLLTDSPIYDDLLSGFTNAFDEIGSGLGWTYENRPTRTRIDQILTGNGWRARQAWVGPQLGSPHHILLADLESVTPLPWATSQPNQTPPTAPTPTPAATTD